MRSTTGDTEWRLVRGVADARDNPNNSWSEECTDNRKARQDVNVRELQGYRRSAEGRLPARIKKKSGVAA